MIKIKNLEIPSHVIQSPMAGCTDLAFRLIGRKHGMRFAFLEMVSAEALIRNHKKTHSLLKTELEDSPLGAQIVGCRPEAMAEAAEMIEGMGFDLLDINLGCPAPKITSPGAGSALLKDPSRAKAIFGAVMKRIRKIPVTVKMRLGYSDSSGEEAKIIAQHAEDAGLAAVAVHGRTREQAYRGQADWKAIGRIKSAIGIPLWGNGDIFTPQDASRMIAESGCDGVMIGRGALGNPWIYKNIDSSLDHLDWKEPDFIEKKQVLLDHLKLEAQFEGDHPALLKGRRISCWYFKGVSGVHELRKIINQAPSLRELIGAIENFEPQPGPLNESRVMAEA